MLINTSNFISTVERESVRQQSVSYSPPLDETQPLISYSLEEFQKITQEGVFYGVHESPFGLVVAAVFQSRLCGLVFQGNMLMDYLVEQAQKHLKIPLNYYHPEITGVFVEKIFKGEQPLLSLAGTPFQIEVWKHLLTIPKGKIITFYELALELNKPRAMRSIGQALKANPLPYVLPCHRVISSSGKMGGYRWGTGLKEQLLASEGYEEAVRLLSFVKENL